jgi:pimeloyl-ACP methyl ester carboxylesterase
MPPTIGQARVNGVTLDYVEQGQGAPVVFVHGATIDHRAWEGQREAVARYYRYIALTQRYFGTSPWPDAGEKYSLTTHADDLTTFIRNLNAGPVHLVGWSYGGTISLTVGVRHPELVKSLFLFEGVGTSHISDPSDAKAVAEDRAAMAGPAAAASNAGDMAGAVRLFMDGVNGQAGAFDALDASSRSILLDNARTVPLHVRAPAPPTITPADLKQMTLPVAIARGECTRPCFRIPADTAHRCIPGSRLIVIPNGRHNAPYADPLAFNDALLGFLRDA